MSHDPLIPPPATHRLKIPLVVAALLAITGAAAGITVRATDQRHLVAWTAEQQVPTVELAVPLSPRGEHSMTLPGHIEAWASAPIHARVSGYLKHWNKDIGAKVNAGEALGTIETPELDQQLDAAKAALARAAANLRLAQLTSQRWQHLLTSNSVSQQEAAEKSGDAEVADANVRSAQAEVARLEALESFKTLTAPFAGTVTSRNTDVGDLISSSDANNPPLFTISDTSRLRLYVSVPQGYAGAVKPGVAVTLNVLEHPGKTFHATLIGSSSAVSQRSGTMLAQFEVPNADNALLPGDYAEVQLPLPAATSAITLPATVMLFRAQGSQVAVLGADGHVQLRDVHIAVDHGSSLEIDRGIGPNDRIIDHPSDSLAQGDEVRVMAKAVPVPTAQAQTTKGGPAHGGTTSS